MNNKKGKLKGDASEILNKTQQFLHDFGVDLSRFNVQKHSNDEDDLEVHSVSSEHVHAQTFFFKLPKIPYALQISETSGAHGEFVMDVVHLHTKEEESKSDDHFEAQNHPVEDDSHNFEVKSITSQDHIGITKNFAHPKAGFQVAIKSMVSDDKILSLRVKGFQPTSSARRIKVTKTDDQGRNIEFRDTKTGAVMTKAQFVEQIKNGAYPGFHVRKIKGVETPVSNPDASDENNLS